MTVTRGDMTMAGSPALAIQPSRETLDVSLYVDRRIVLKVMVSNARSRGD
jgi:hypothetical protein